MLTFSGNVIRGMLDRDHFVKPEYYFDDKLWTVKETFKGDKNTRHDWYLIASFNSEEEMKAWAESYYGLHPFATPDGNGPKAVPKPYWNGESRRQYLRNLPRHLGPSGVPGRTYYPEFRMERGQDEECIVWDTVRDGADVPSYEVSRHPNFAMAKIWAAGYYGFGGSGGVATRYVAPLPPMKEAEKKLLLLV